MRGLDDRVRLFGELDGNLTHLERGAGVALHVDGDEVVITGDAKRVAIASAALEGLIKAARSGSDVTALDVELALRAARDGLEVEAPEGSLATTRRGRPIRPRTPGQRALVDAVAANTLVFAIGPAGTGKTFLAVTMALAALRAGRVQRIILSRPAVEAGEKLGFLPGDLQEKVDPYLRPLFDALGEILEPLAVTRAVERGQIELAPLAYMRGRTLSDSFIVLDEAQNTTNEQMKMFLTRIGAGSRMLVCGDVTQIDLPSQIESGLVAAARMFEGVADTAIVQLGDADIVRHPLIRRIIDAYQRGRR
ncbi:MAG: PhoH family protein [Candidatus Eremiobacteraeota bacterium]|nr:PhoH family protein [Candidatus Eremiobacteraeota bacterium]